MKTYLIHSNSKKRLDELAAHPLLEKHTSHAWRAVVVVRARKIPEDLFRGVTIADEIPGDVFEEKAGWVRSNVVEELHTQFLARGRAKPAAQKKAIERWLEKSEERKELEQRLEKAREEEHEASCTLLRTIGKVPVTVDEDIYDPNYTRERVYYQKRSS